MSVPFQDNLRHLDPDVVLECVQGLMRRRPSAAAGAPFADWLQATFGAGICRHFMVPYNRKVWATPWMR